RRNVAAGGAVTSSARSRRARGLARAVAAALGCAEGCASAPDPAGRSAAERALIGGYSTAAPTGPAAARDERATSAVGNRPVGNPDDAVGRGTAGPATRDAWEHQANSTVAGTRGKIGDTIIAVSRDNAGDTCTRRQCQARNVPLADAGCNADDALGRNCADDVNAAVRRTRRTQASPIADAGANPDAAFGPGHAGSAITGAWRERQARNAATTNAGCKALRTDNAVSRDHAGRAIVCKQARNVAAAGARCKTAGAVSAPGADQTDHRLALAASSRRCQTR